MEPVYNTELVETKKITLPIDENTYYLSKSIFQFENKGKEYLSFGNQSTKQYATEIIIYDLDLQNIHKRFPLLKEGPNAIPAAYGGVPWEGMNAFVFFQNNIDRISLSDSDGKLIRQYSVQSPDGKPVRYLEGFSYVYWPSFMIDSVTYFRQGVNKPSVGRNEWKTIPMFASLNLRNGEVSRSTICFPSIFDKDVKDVTSGYSFAYDYNYSSFASRFMPYSSPNIVF